VVQAQPPLHVALEVLQLSGFRELRKSGDEVFPASICGEGAGEEVEANAGCPHQRHLLTARLEREGGTGLWDGRPFRHQVGLVAFPTTATATLPSFTCGTQSGGTDIHNPTTVSAIRVGRHDSESPAYDRFVVEFSSGPSRATPINALFRSFTELASFRRY
jgi:hypothetical protein